MKPKVLQEEEYFDSYYPKELGDWRKKYNIQAYKDGKFQGVCWMCYKRSGVVLSGDEEPGNMKIIPSSSDRYIESIFLECGSANTEPSAHYIQPYMTSDGKFWAQITVEKMESNLDLYMIHISGDDDASYSLHCLGKSEVKKMFHILTRDGMNSLKDITSLGFFFTN